MALRPFVRQFAHIDEAAWQTQPWPYVQCLAGFSLVCAGDGAVWGVGGVEGVLFNRKI